MTQYVIYRTKKGNLSWKMTDEIAYTVMARSKQNAEEMMAHLKTIEKNKQEDAL